MLGLFGFINEPLRVCLERGDEISWVFSPGKLDLLVPRRFPLAEHTTISGRREVILVGYIMFKV